MKASWICAALLALTCTLRQGSAQNVPCFTSIGCNDATGGVGNLATIPDCCGMIDTLTYRPTEDSESCLSCYAFGWVTNIADDLSMAEVQPDILMASEGQTITLTLFMVKNIPPNNLRLNFFIRSSGSATEGDDYIITPESTFPTLPADIVFSRVPVQVNVTLLNDGVAGEGQEDVRITLVQETDSTPIEGNRVLIRDSVLITFQDNDIVSGFSVDAITITEGGVESVCLQTVGTPALPTVVDVAVEFGTAGPTDFNLITTSLTITPTLTAPCVEFEALRDNLGLEDQETVTLVLSGPSNVQLTSPNLTITIEDADIPQPTFDHSMYTILENKPTFPLCVDVGVVLSEPMEFLITSQRTHPSPEAQDAGYVNTTITVFSGSGRACINYTNFVVDNDVALEGEQKFNIYVGDSSALVAIVDDDVFKVQFKERDYSFFEGDSNTNVCLQGSGDIAQAVTVTVSSLEQGTATVGVDYVALESVSATFLPGGDNVVCVLVELLHDSVLEGNESFSVEITSVSQISGVVTGQLNSTTVVIRDSSVVSFESTTYTVTEGIDEFAQIILIRAGGLSRETSVVVTTFDATANAGSDYSSTVQEVVIAPGDMRAIVNIAILNDNIAESDEIFIAVLSGDQINDASASIKILDIDVPCPTLADPKYGRVVLSGTSLGDTATYTCRIGYELDGNSVLNCGHDGKWDNSLPTCQGPSVWFEPTTYSVTEGTDEYVEIVIQSKNVKEVFAVNVSFVADSAEGGTDFVSTPKVIVFAPGEREDRVRVPIIDDSIAEETETFTAKLSMGDDNTEDYNTAIVFLLDDDNDRQKPISAIIATVSVIPLVSVIVVAILLVIICIRKRRQKELNLDRIYDDPDSAYIAKDNKKVSSTTGTMIPLHDLPNVKENLALAHQQQHQEQQ